MIEGLQLGRIVHYVTTQGVRAAVVVRVWDKGNGLCNLQLFLDGENDLSLPGWETSRLYSEAGEVGTWHWPPRA
jgi:hypothetical protein